jgi:hypothetical protein
MIVVDFGVCRAGAELARRRRGCSAFLFSLRRSGGSFLDHLDCSGAPAEITVGMSEFVGPERVKALADH